MRHLRLHLMGLPVRDPPQPSLNRRSCRHARPQRQTPSEDFSSTSLSGIIDTGRRMDEQAALPHWENLVKSQLAMRIIGTNESRFNTALTALDEHLRLAINGQRILILGGAGFIARQALSILLRFHPSHVGIVDISENGLADLMRGLRASNAIPAETIVDPWLADIGQPSFTRLVQSLENVDVVFNFAAVKHVRSERDLPSLLRMLEVNLLATHSSTHLLQQRFHGLLQFVVSTDKASDPANFMGASKRAMEIALASLEAHTTTARFANVAFSSGSLLESWLRRLSARQPVVAPEDTWRYFVTPYESGQLCVAASMAPPNTTVIPRFTSSELILLEDALCSTLEFFGLQPLRVADAGEARARISEGIVDAGNYPYFLSPRDTAGEKQVEQLFGGDEAVSDWQPGLNVMPMTGDRQAVITFIEWLTNIIAQPGISVSAEDIHRRLTEVVPTFSHQDGAARLDDRV